MYVSTKKMSFILKHFRYSQGKTTYGFSMKVNRAVSREYETFTMKKQTPFFYSTLSAKLFLGRLSVSTEPPAEPMEGEASETTHAMSDVNSV
jgi:hypothetical protein